MNWPTVKLGDICKFVYGDSLPQYNRISGGVSVYGSNGIVGEHNSSITNGETIIVGRKGSVGQVNWSKEGCYPIDTTYYIDKDSSDQNLRWLFWQLKALKLSDLNKAAAVPGLNRDDAYRLKISLPPIEEQKRIAALLDTADNVLQLREKAIEKLNLLAQSVFNELYEKIESSQVAKIGEILDIQRGASPRPIAKWITNEVDGVNWVKISDATASDKYIFTCKEKIKKEAVKMSRYVESGDFLLSNSMSFGRPYILRTDGCIHDGWLLLRDVNNSFEQDFLFSALCSREVVSQFKKYAIGAVVKNLNIDAVSKVEIKIPPMKDQKYFASKIREIEAAKSVQLKQLEVANEIFTSLQHQSFAVN